MSPITAEPGIVELTREEGRQMLASKVRQVLGKSLEQFEADFDAGKLDVERPEVEHLAMLLPFAR